MSDNKLSSASESGDGSTPVAAPRLFKPATFNINHRVRLRITPAGHDYLKRTGKASMLTPGYSTAIDEATGLATWQLWVVMETFGPAIYVGGALTFETEIELVPEDRPSVPDQPAPQHGTVCPKCGHCPLSVRDGLCWCPQPPEGCGNFETRDGIPHRVTPPRL